MHKQITYLFSIIICVLCVSKNLTAQISSDDSCAFFNNKPILPYYVVISPQKQKDFYTRKKEFKKAITLKTDFSGIITVYFYINELGQTNFYTAQVCNLGYFNLVINEAIHPLCNQIVDAVKNTGPWGLQFNQNKEPVNCRKFYSFKFNNGTLIEILPK